MKSILVCFVSFLLYAATTCLGQSGVACSNWLYTPSQPSYVSVGDLDVPENQITVEAMINRTTPYTGGPLFAGDIVSKHEDVTDAKWNYD
jgi:hypothetical protein